MIKEKEIKRGIVQGHAAEQGEKIREEITFSLFLLIVEIFLIQFLFRYHWLVSRRANGEAVHAGAQSPLMMPLSGRQHRVQRQSSSQLTQPFTS